MKKGNHLEKLDFEVKEKLDKSINHDIGIYVADKMTRAFPYLDYDTIVERITNCSIYVAKIPERYSRVNYVYQDFSIYIAEDFKIEEANNDIFFLHEIMHYLQDSRHRNGDLHKMGLCEFKVLGVSGLALNESAIQYVVSKITNQKTEKMKCFEIELNTYNKTYYPILSNLLLQINHIFDESYMVKSLFRNDHSFKDAFCELCQNSISYKALKANLDIMLGCRDVIINNSILLKDTNLSEKERKTIKTINAKSVKRIQDSFFVIQNLLTRSYFKAMLRHIGDRMKAEDFPKMVADYENYIGKLEGHNEYQKYAKKYLKIWEKKYNKKQ